MKKFPISLFAFLMSMPAFAQLPYNAAVPNGYTKKAMVAEEIGLTMVSITYHRPAVNGREGQIWGGVIHQGFIDQGFGNGKPAPWRAGANENTLIEFDNDIKVEGKPLPKGKYALFIAYEPTESTLIFSKKTNGWGSFFYNEQDDALRVKVKPVPLENSVEHLKYEFSKPTVNSSTVTLSWEKLSIPFKIEVDHLKQQFEAFVTESQHPQGFTSEGLNIAASWSLQNNYQLEKGLEWATTATAKNFPGNPTSFSALLTKAAILEKLNRQPEAMAVMLSALPYGNMAQLQQAGRQFIAAKDPKTALEIFKYNYTQNPDQFIAIAGMIRGLSANGEYAKALEMAQKALPLATNDANKKAVEGMMEKLRGNQDIN